MRFNRVAAFNIFQQAMANIAKNTGIQPTVSYPSVYNFGRRLEFNQDSFLIWASIYDNEVRHCLYEYREMSKCNGGVYPLMDSTGLCGSILAGIPDRVLRVIMYTWPKHSMNASFPVPATDGSNNPHRFYFKRMEDKTMNVGPYGKLRLELLEHTIQVLCVMFDVNLESIA